MPEHPGHVLAVAWGEYLVMGRIQVLEVIRRSGSMPLGQSYHWATGSISQHKESLFAEWYSSRDEASDH